jgi:serine protease Do/serine protease DegQ
MKRIVPILFLSAQLAGAAQGAMPVPLDPKGLPTLAPMLAQVTPGVVNISVTSRDPAESNPLLRDPFFRRFFNIPDQQAKPQQSAGSGVIVDAARGLVLTNHHVIKDAQEVTVTLKDRRQLRARLVGSDPGTDVAMLRIPPERLSAVRFGDSDALSVGDFVVAIGNPFGIGQTVTSGIVSALGRTGLGIEGYEEFIQTDASINPGNSGGALVNLRGELIGINTAIIGPAGGNVGIGFAIPVNMIRSVMDQLLRFGEVKRGRIGVTTDDLTPDMARKLGIGITEGAVIVAVDPKSPAQSAGLRARDIVVAANGKPVRNSIDVRNRVGLTPVGEEVELRVLRGGESLTVRARVAEPYVATQLPGEAVPQLAGAKVSDIEPGMPMYGSVEGAIIVAVENGSAAAQSGLQPGDIIYGVNRRRVRGARELLEGLRTGERPLRISLLRGEYRLTLTIR